jgi:hypothetical protein
MKRIYTGLLFLFLLAAFSPFSAFSQNSKTQRTGQDYPSSFLISKTEMQEIIAMKVHSVIDKKKNRYLDGSIVMNNTRNGDMQFVKVRLAFFRKAFLNVQVNGKDSTQVFITSDDKSVFYKGSLEKENWVMLKCEEDEIVSE